MSKNDSQDLFDSFIKQIELSIREIGYGDVSINKKMKEYVNLFYLILEAIDKWDNLEMGKKKEAFSDLLNIDEDNVFFINYFDKYSHFLSKNPLKIFTKDILELKF